MGRFCRKPLVYERCSPEHTRGAAPAGSFVREQLSPPGLALFCFSADNRSLRSGATHDPSLSPGALSEIPLFKSHFIEGATPSEAPSTESHSIQDSFHPRLLPPRSFHRDPSTREPPSASPPSETDHPRPIIREPSIREPSIREPSIRDRSSESHPSESHSSESPPSETDHPRAVWERPTGSLDTPPP